MKNVVIVILAGSTLLNANGCSKKGSSKPLPQSSPAKTVVSGVTTEAKEFALELWKMTKLGDSHYVYVDDNVKMIYEFKDPSVIVEGKLGNETDRLNGLEWSGQVYILTKAIREYRLTPDPYHNVPDHKWTEWESCKESPLYQWNHPMHISLEKRNGKLQIPPKNMGPPPFKKITLSDIPRDNQ